jgi:hypothetical protein
VLLTLGVAALLLIFCWPLPPHRAAVPGVWLRRRPIAWRISRRRRAAAKSELVADQHASCA